MITSFSFCTTPESFGIYTIINKQLHPLLQHDIETTVPAGSLFDFHENQTNYDIAPYTSGNIIPVVVHFKTIIYTETITFDL